MLRIALAALHLMALGIGLGSIFARARAAHRLSGDPGALERALRADNLWAVAAVLWIGTGLWRWLGSIEKSAAYYNTNHVFFAKMGLLALILVLEIWPMVTLMRWRMAGRRGTLPAPEEVARKGRLIARISDVQLLLVLCMVVAAVMMARGYGAGG